MKKALVLAGGDPQIELIRNLKARGYEVILADYLENPPARPHADRFYRISTLDVPAIRMLAHDLGVDFLITVCTDQALLTVAAVSEDLHLPCYIDAKTALRVTNKAHMKKVFEDYGVPSSPCRIVSTEAELEDLGLAFPLVVKPVDCNSSKGVARVGSPDELREAFRVAQALSRTRTAIVEGFVSGEELSADVYVEGGIARLLSVSRLEKLPIDGRFVISSSFCSARLMSRVGAEVTAVAQKIADGFGLRDTPMLIQMLEGRDGLNVLEFSARTGGGEKYRTVRRVSGFDVIDAVIELTLGARPHVKARAFTGDACVATQFVYAQAARLGELRGAERLVRAGVVEDLYAYKPVGGEIGGARGSGDRVAGFTLCGDERTLAAKLDRVREELAVVGEDGRDVTAFREQWGAGWFERIPSRGEGGES